MSGNYSRRKGSRIEYEIRDLFRAEGYVADRVPSSGAAQGFKGDIKITNVHGESYLVEVKGRKAEFGKVYELRDMLDQFPGRCNGFATLIDGAYKLVTVVRSIKELFTTHSDQYLWVSDNTPKFTKQIKKCLSLQKYVKDCHLLVVKDDRRAPLFLRFE